MSTRQDYKAEVAREHKSKIVRKYFSLYCWFWFHTEFWLAPLDRRPYTFIMRDWIYPHMKWFIVMEIIWNLGMGYITIALISSMSILWMLSGWLSAHLIWGSAYIPGEQENPQVEDI